MSRMATTSSSRSSSKIQTRFLILSDTHGAQFSPENFPQQRVDVALHCGDLTDGSKLEEFRASLEVLKAIKAPLKLVIAGNHDFSMDGPAFEAKVAEAYPPLDPELVAREYGTLGQARQLFDECEEDGIVFLDEGSHSFRLDNGARLTVYASPYTPSMGAWGFQYHPDKGHKFDIAHGTNIVMTHGPPRGIMDYTYGRERAGCPDLFSAVAEARPQVHGFGHIHEGWGARLVSWRDSNNSTSTSKPSHFTAIDNERSVTIATLASLKENRLVDSEQMAEAKRAKLEQLSKDRCASSSHCVGAAPAAATTQQDEYPLQRGRQTLFVNASIEGCEDFVQRPWIVDIELDAAAKE